MGAKLNKANMFALANTPGNAKSVESIYILIENVAMAQI